MAHTPGPWHVNKKYPTKVNGPEEAPGVLVDCGENVQFTEAIDNARLIAAAPSLLAACETAWIGSQHDDDCRWWKYSTKELGTAEGRKAADESCDCHKRDLRLAISLAKGGA